MGCDGHKDGELVCLRGKSVNSIVQGQSPAYNQSMRTLQLPVQDGYELPGDESLAALFASGRVPAKPMLAGTNKDDMSAFFIETIPEILHGVKAGDIATSVDRFYPGLARAEKQAILKLFDPANFGGDVYQALYQLGLDGYYSCPTRRVINAMVEGGAETYRYRFSKLPQEGFIGFLKGILGVFDLQLSDAVYEKLDKYFFSKTKPCNLTGVTHGHNEALFWSADQPNSTATDAEVALGRQMTKMWAKFVSGNAPWSQYGAEERFVDLDGKGNVESIGLDRKECALLERYAFVWNPITRNDAQYFLQSV